MHYDLPWNPTRLEQREGRVDRYGQTAPQIRVATMQGDNPTLDPLIRKHLIDKHHAIKQQLGFSIPVPGITDEIIDAVATEWLYGPSRQTTLDLDGAEARWRDADRTRTRMGTDRHRPPLPRQVRPADHRPHRCR